MPKRSRTDKQDENELAKSIVDQAVGDAETTKKNAAAVALGRLGGKKGGPARAKKLTAERRREIARKAAETRWRNQSDAQSE